MKKFLMGFLVGIAIVFNSTSYVKASTDMDKQYKQAYDSTMKVVDIANKYGVRPFWKSGQCLYDDVIKSVIEGNMDKEIIKARNEITKLPKSIQIHKNTLSEILDNYDQQLYYQVIYGLWQMDVAIDHRNSINKEESSYHMYVGFDYCQKLIMNNRILIENMSENYKPSYRTAIDERQQKLLNSLVKTVDFTETINDPSFKYYTIESINKIKAYTYKDKVLQDFLEPLLERANSLKIGHVVKDEEIVGWALNNGFKEIRVDSEAIYGNEPAYKLLVNKQGDGIEFYRNSKTILFKYKKSKVDSRESVLGFMAPSQKEFLISCGNSGMSNISAATNGFFINLKSLGNSDVNIYEFSRLYYEE